MFHDTINYTPDGRVNLVCYGLERYSGQDGLMRPAIIVIPGGGYSHQSTSEDEPVALTWNALGYSTFVLHYGVMEYAVYPDVLEETAWAIKTVRDHAEEWNVDPDKIAVMGFSAGGNLASMIATQWHDPAIAGKFGVEPEYIRPNAAVLGYGLYYFDPAEPDAPVDAVGKIMADREPHAATLDFIDERTVPCFICACRWDEFVPSRHSLKFALKMDEYDLPYELFMTQSGVHGLSVNNQVSVRRGRPIDSSWDRWVEQCDIWLRKTFGYEGWVSPENAGANFL